MVWLSPHATPRLIVVDAVECSLSSALLTMWNQKLSRFKIPVIHGVLESGFERQLVRAFHLQGVLSRLGTKQGETESAPHLSQAGIVGMQDSGTKIQVHIVTVR